MDAAEPIRYFSIVIVGMKYNNVEIKPVLELTKFFLKPEPTNKYDKNAVQVYGNLLDNAEAVLIGHVAKSELGKLPELPPEGDWFEARVVYRETANAVYSLLYTN
jgi:hypothetical protein